jgi:hypothetical protein
MLTYKMSTGVYGLCDSTRHFEICQKLQSYDARNYQEKSEVMNDGEIRQCDTSVGPHPNVP